ncbi:hypothetical protein HY230_05340 [Candidatus Acetothermia bacterium]|nr:hypothetical protein [Candidatus Acetothermia bacterium]
MKTKVKESMVLLSETSHVLLNETVEYAGKFLTAYARLREAERNNNEDAVDSAWGEMMTALSLLKDKTEHAYEFLDQELEDE